MNVLGDVPEYLPDELTEVLHRGQGLRIERTVSKGHSSPEGFWYDQQEHEWVLVLNGAARIAFEDSTVELGPADSINIPAHTKHRVAWTTSDEPTIWLAVHYSGNGRDGSTPHPQPDTPPAPRR